MQIISLPELIKQEKIELGHLQSVGKPIYTQRDYLEYPLGGFIPGDVLTIAAGAGVGKSYELNILKNRIMNRDINPESEDFVFLDISLEMRVLTLMVRQLSQEMSISKKEIFFNRFTQDQQERAKVIVDNWADKRFYVCQSETTAESFYAATKQFCEEHKDKKAVFISCDHLALLSGGSGKKTSIIEDFLGRVNDLKLQYKNTYFILISQLNSDYFNRASEKDRNAEPKPNDLFYSSSIFHLSSYVVVKTNPSKLGITEYSKVKPDRYPHLDKYFTQPDNKGKVSFHTDDLLFYHLLKNREADPGYVDIFVEEIKPFTRTESWAIPTVLPDFLKK